MSGHADSMMELARLYFNGEGLSQNRAQALKWVTKASKAGNKEAKDFLEAIVAQSSVR